jgi:RNA polymerase sigma factor (sigma-70 family)
MANDAGRAEVELREAELVERARGGDAEAFGLLYDAWFDRVHDLARRIVHDPAGAADVAQDAFLAAWRNLHGLRDPAAFGGWLLRITRNTAFDRRRHDDRARPVDSEAMAVIEDRGPSAADAPAGFRVEERAGELGDPALVAEDEELTALVWESADALGARDAEVLHLHLRHGFKPAEIAETVGITRNHANQLVHRVKQRLGGAIRARVLWRGGQPACDDLAAALRAAGIERFGAEAVEVATDHADRCDACSERRTLRLSPTALFAATPIAAAPVALKERIADGLAGHGVPMAGSRHAPERRGRRPRNLLRAGIAAAATVALGAGAALLAGGGDSGPGSDAAAPDRRAALVTTTTTSSTTTTTTQPPPQPITPGDGPALAPTPDAPAGPPGGTAADAVVEEPPPPPPPPPPVTADLTLAPDTIPMGYPMSGAPVLAWSTSGGAAVLVTGPGFSSSAAGGSAPVCPGSTAAVCTASAGTYTYTLVVEDGLGQVVAHRTATLTIV